MQIKTKIKTKLSVIKGQELRIFLYVKKDLVFFLNPLIILCINRSIMYKILTIRHTRTFFRKMNQINLVRISSKCWVLNLKLSIKFAKL